MKLFADLVYLIAPDVPGCPDPVIEQALLNAARTFCHKSTWLWLHDIGPIAPVADTAEYDISSLLPEGYEVVSVLQAYQGKRGLLPMPRRPISKSTARTATHFLSPSPAILGLHPIPLTAGEDVYLVVAAKPSISAAGADDTLLDEFQQEIIHGAKAELKLMPKPWRDVALADFHMREFRRGWAMALMRALRGNTGYVHTFMPEVV